MSKIEIAWEIDGGQITAEESVLGMIDVIRSKSIDHTGTFWTWKNEVSWTTRLLLLLFLFMQASQLIFVQEYPW
jgi:hypothetical protein